MFAALSGPSVFSGLRPAKLHEIQGDRVKSFVSSLRFFDPAVQLQSRFLGFDNHFHHQVPSRIQNRTRVVAWCPLIDKKQRNVAQRCYRARESHPGFWAMDTRTGYLPLAPWLDRRKAVRAESPHPSYLPPKGDLHVHRKKRLWDISCLPWRPLLSNLLWLRETQPGQSAC